VVLTLGIVQVYLLLLQALQSKVPFTAGTAASSLVCVHKIVKADGGR